MNNKLNKSILILLVFTLLVAPVNVFAIFGMSSGNIGSDNLIPGSKFDHTVKISYGAVDTESIVSVIFEGESLYLKDWISLDNSDIAESGYSIKVPAGQTEMKLLFHVDVPLDTALGTYKGQIKVVHLLPNSDLDNGGAVMSVNEGGIVPVNLVVGNKDVIDLKPLSLEVFNTEVNKPLGLILKVSNDGNSKAMNPYKLDVKVLNLNNKQNVLLSEVLTSNIVLEPFTTTDVEFITTKYLDQDGNYLVIVDVYEGDKLVKVVKNFEKVIKVTKQRLDGGQFPVVVENLVLPESVQVQGSFKISAELSNIGNFPVNTNLVVDLFSLEDQALIDVFDGETVNLMPSQKKTINLYYSPDKPGKIKVSAYPKYDGTSGASKEAVVDVIKEVDYSTIGFVVMLVLIIGLLVWILLINKGKKHVNKSKRK
ncbi:MAG: hypothetical protein ABIG89_04850 [Candidatus Woesearchaeota archaeon]